MYFNYIPEKSFQSELLFVDTTSPRKTRAKNIFRRNSIVVSYYF
nr:MAG TPA: hypothetical protein [Caudoviricetes sp.]